MHDTIVNLINSHFILRLLFFLAVAGVSFALARSESRRGSPFAGTNIFIGVIALLMALLSLLVELFKIFVR